MAYRLWILPWDMVSQQSPDRCELAGVVDDETFIRLREKFHIDDPLEQIELFEEAFRSGDVNAPPSAFRDYVEQYSGTFTKMMPSFILTRASLDTLEGLINEGGSSKETLERLKRAVETSRHGVIAVGFDMVSDESKKYSISGTLEAPKGCYLIWFEELDSVTKDDLLGWQWVSGEHRDFKVTYDEGDFKGDIDDFLDGKPELGLKVFRWNGTGFDPVDRCEKTSKVEVKEEVTIRISEDGKLEVAGDGWKCG